MHGTGRSTCRGVMDEPYLMKCMFFLYKSRMSHRTIKFLIDSIVNKYFVYDNCCFPFPAQLRSRESTCTMAASGQPQLPKQRLPTRDTELGLGKRRPRNTENNRCCLMRRRPQQGRMRDRRTRNEEIRTP